MPLLQWFSASSWTCLSMLKLNMDWCWHGRNDCTGQCSSEMTTNSDGQMAEAVMDKDHKTVWGLANAAPGMVKAPFGPFRKITVGSGCHSNPNVNIINIRLSSAFSQSMLALDWSRSWSSSVVGLLFPQLWPHPLPSQLIKKASGCLPISVLKAPLWHLRRCVHCLSHRRHGMISHSDRKRQIRSRWPLIAISALLAETWRDKVKRPAECIGRTPHYALVFLLLFLMLSWSYYHQTCAQKGDHFEVDKMSHRQIAWPWGRGQSASLQLDYCHRRVNSFGRKQRLRPLISGRDYLVDLSGRAKYFFRRQPTVAQLFRLSLIQLQTLVNLIWTAYVLHYSELFMAQGN